MLGLDVLGHEYIFALSKVISPNSREIQDLFIMSPNMIAGNMLVFSGLLHVLFLGDLSSLILLLI